MGSDIFLNIIRVQELCESRGGRPGLSVLMSLMVSVDVKQHVNQAAIKVRELCESRGGRPGLSIIMSLTVSVDVKQH